MLGRYDGRLGPILVRMVLAGVPVAAQPVAALAGIVRRAGADKLANRLEQALADGVSLLGNDA